jgi:hypothetical protein
MNEDQKKQLIDEVNTIIRSRKEFIERYYPSIRSAYNNDYKWPELDPLRREICLSIMFGLCQAAITLTNHFMESLLKYALIIQHGHKNEETEDKITGKIVTSFGKKYKEGMELYDNANLDKTINSACRGGLITKEQKIKLHQFRERYRNAYSHSDKTKTFGGSTIPVTGLRFENECFIEDEQEEIEVAELIIVQGLAQAIMAQEDALPYFLYMDNLAREIMNKLFGTVEEIKKTNESDIYNDEATL